MPEYKEIYNHIVENDDRYNVAENSPGLRFVIQATNQLSMITGRSLDIGCGVGFVVEYLCSPGFNLRPFGVDISDLAVERARTRLGESRFADQFATVDDQRLPFEDGSFSLVTCFDMLEHLDVGDIDTTLEEVKRVLRPGGVFFGSVSCRTSGASDQFGDNLHRTVQGLDWWVDRIQPDRAQYDGRRKQMSFWRNKPANRKKQK